MPTPKSLRAQPTSCRLEDYILVRTVGHTAGLVDIDDSKFTLCSPSLISNDYDPGRGFQDMGISSPIEIGFTFKLDDVSHKRFIATTKGYIVLVDDSVAFSLSDIFNDGRWTQNSAIKPTLTRNHAVVAPWFDNLRNLADSIGILSSSNNPYTFYGMSLTQLDRLNGGLDAVPYFMNAHRAGVRYYRDSGRDGRRLIVRWNSLSNFAEYESDVLRFEVVLYENGRIEFRYASKAQLVLSDNVASSVGASIGVFVNGYNRHRDFSYGLGYRDDVRSRYRYGGSVYESGFIDTDTTAASLSSSYACMLNPQQHWPSKNDVGAMYTFMPQMNRRKILPRVEQRNIDSRLTLPIVQRTGDVQRLGNEKSTYDDRRSTVQYGYKLVTEAVEPTLKPGNNIDGMYSVVVPTIKNNNPNYPYHYYGNSTTTTTRIASGDPNHLYDMIFRYDALTSGLNWAHPYFIYRFPSDNYSVYVANSTASHLSNYYIPPEYNGGKLTFDQYNAPFAILVNGYTTDPQYPLIGGEQPFAIGERDEYAGVGCVVSLITSDPPNVYLLSDPGGGSDRHFVNFSYAFRIPVRGGSEITLKTVNYEGDNFKASKWNGQLWGNPSAEALAAADDGYWSQLTFLDSKLTERVYPFDLYSPALGDADTDHHYAETVQTVQKYEGQPELVYNVLLCIYGMTECCNCDGVKLPDVMQAGMQRVPTPLSEFYLPYIWNYYSNLVPGTFYAITALPDGTQTTSQNIKPLVLTGSLVQGETKNLLTLQVSDPPATYVLNNNTNAGNYIHIYDYNINIPIRGGATITLKYEVHNGVQIKATKLGTWDLRGSNWLTGPGTSPCTTEPAGDGQFVYVAFVSRSIAEFGTAQIETVTSPLIVNYPTTLPRYYSETDDGGVRRQDLFSGDFETTGAINTAASEQFIVIEDSRVTAPFSEDKIFASGSSDPFYSSAANISELGLDISSPLSSKTQVKLTLPINYGVKLLGTASTIHYYNSRQGTWNIPHGAADDIVLDRSVDSLKYRIIEDQRGFGPIGNNLASGSFNKSGYSEHTDSVINAPYSKNSYTEAISKRFDNSITVSEKYEASVDESFTLPISQPFLLEKAVIEIPFAAGDGWFLDTTQCMTTIEDTGNGFDFGGPGITVSLLNQHSFASGSIRDIVLSGTFTHQQDNINELVFSKFEPYDSTYHLRPKGFLAYGGKPAAVVTPTVQNEAYTYTGSVQLKCESMVSNGVLLRVDYGFYNNMADNQPYVVDAFNRKDVALSNYTSTDGVNKSYNIAYVNNIGRGGTGFQPSPRSVYGKEFVSSDKVYRGAAPNPFYIAAGNGAIASPDYNGLPQQFIDALNDGTYFNCEAVLPVENHKPSPYLVMPGDRFILAVSKTRPVYMGGVFPDPYTSGSIVHDVQLITGTVHITLFGSLLREGREFHDTLNQPLASDAIHELICGSPTLDQFDSNYSESYVSGSNDDVVVGNMASKLSLPSGITAIETGSRGRVCSSVNAAEALQRGTSEFDSSTLLSYRLQPYSELAGTPRLTQAIDENERYWDSLMPAINQCFAANGAKITTTYVFVDPDYKPVGSIYFDFGLPGFMSEPSFGRSTDNSWTKSYPYEPRYANCTRLVNIQKSFVSTWYYDNGATYSQFPVTLPSFFCGPVGDHTPQVPNPNPPSLVADTNYAAIVASDYNYDDADNYFEPQLDDLIKILYGFGDINNMKLAKKTGVGQTAGIIGTNHFVDFRYYKVVGSTYRGVSPIIRGWKYGVYSGLPSYTKAYYRTNRYGQFRDMLEQRQYTKFYYTNESDITASTNGESQAVVSVRFTDVTGKAVDPINTQSQNLSIEVTSSFPYFDGETRNRADVNVNVTNSTVVSF